MAERPKARARVKSCAIARQLRRVRRDPPRLILREQLGRRPPPRLFFEIDVGQLLPAAVFHNECGADVLDRPGWRETAGQLTSPV
jgi:hypothetical protein